MSLFENVTESSASSSLIHQRSMICWLCFGCIALLNSSLILITIIKSSVLRTKCYFTIGNLAVADAFTGISFIWTAALSLVVFDGSEGGFQLTAFKCALLSFPVNWDTRLSRMLTMTLGVDRYLCVAYPIAYRTRWTKMHTGLLNLGTWIISSALSVLFITGIDQSKMLDSGRCSSQSAFAPDLDDVDTWIDVTIGCAIVIIYTATSFKLNQHMKKAKSKDTTEFRKTNRELEVAVFKTIAVVVVLSVLLLLVPDILIGCFSATGNELARDYLAVLDLLQCVFSSSHLLVYYSTSKDFRKSFQSVICGRKSDVHSLSGNRAPVLML